ncbi:hypothetical protein HDU96_008364 [Phlyctochytrium bullatum]|nr:hypothetical protein HDU96_008364 [Phlyctochytrium bullatum]
MAVVSPSSRSSSSTDPSAQLQHPLFTNHLLLHRIASHLPPSTLTTTLPRISRLFHSLFAPPIIPLSLALDNLANLPTPFHTARLNWRSLGPAHTAAHLIRSRFAMRALHEICRDAVPIRTWTRDTRADFFPVTPCSDHRDLLRAAVAIVHRDMPDVVARMVAWAREAVETLACIGDVGLLRAVLEAMTAGIHPLPASSWDIRLRISSAIISAVTAGNTDTVAMFLDLRRRKKDEADSKPDLWRMDWEDETATTSDKPLTIPEPPLGAFEAAAQANHLDLLTMLLSDTNTRATRRQVLHHAKTADVIELLMGRFSPPDDVLELQMTMLRMPPMDTDAGRRDAMAKLRCLFEDARVVIRNDLVRREMLDAAGEGFREALEYMLHHGRLANVDALLSLPADTNVNIIPSTVLANTVIRRGADDVAFLVAQPDLVVDDQAMELACQHGKLDVLKLLLAHPTAAARRAEHALRAGVVAAGKGFLDMVRHVIDVEEARPCHPGVSNPRMECMVMAAVVGREPAVLEMLLQRHVDGQFACAHLRTDAWEQAFMSHDARCAKLLFPLQELERWEGDEEAEGSETGGKVDIGLGDEDFLGQLHCEYQLPISCFLASLDAGVRAGFAKLTKWLAGAAELDPMHFQRLLSTAFEEGHHEIVSILITQFDNMLPGLNLDAVLNSVSTKLHLVPSFRDTKQATLMQAQVRCVATVLENPVLRSKLNLGKLVGANPHLVAGFPTLVGPRTLNIVAIRAIVDRCKQDPAFFDPSDEEFLRHVFGNPIMQLKGSLNLGKRVDRENEDHALEFLARTVVEDERVDPLFGGGWALRACFEGIRWRMLDVLLEHPKVRARYGEV